MLRASSFDHVEPVSFEEAGVLTSLGFGMSRGAGSASELSRVVWSWCFLF